MMDVTLAIPVVVALVEGAKMTGMDKKYSFILSVALGLVLFYLFGVGELGARMFEGLLAGLSASGLYSGVKTAVKK